MKARSETEELEDRANQIERDTVLWHELKEHGGSDPFWPDGCNMNLTRNHIIYAKERIREICEKTGLPYPEQYAMETPPEVSNDYVARKEDIRIHAKFSLVQYQNDADYRYLREKRDLLSDVQKKNICIDGVLGYVTGLKRNIEADNLIAMRQHEHPERYVEAFRECAKKVRKIIADQAPAMEPNLPLGQLSIFDLFHLETV